MAGTEGLPTPITAARMAERLQQVLVPTQLEVLDESAAHAGHAGAGPEGFGTHFRIRIASPLFTDKPRLARHRLVYDALRELIDQGVHAIAIEVLSPVHLFTATPQTATTLPTLKEI